MSAAISGVGLFADANMIRAMQQAAPPLVKPPNNGTLILAPPTISLATELGNGGGVGIGGGAPDASYGWLDVFAGIGAGVAGAIFVEWPIPPASPLLWTADWPFELQDRTIDTETQLVWTMLGGSLVPSSRPYRISWRWTTPV